MIRRRRMLLAAAVLPLVVLVGMRSAWAAYACRIDGEVRSACCCPKRKAPDRPVDATPRVVAPDCCDVTVGNAERAPDAREATRSAIDDGWAMLPVAPRLDEGAIAEARLVRILPARPPPPSLPTYLAKQALLR